MQHTGHCASNPTSQCPWPKACPDAGDRVVTCLLAVIRDLITLPAAESREETPPRSAGHMPRDLRAQGLDRSGRPVRWAAVPASQVSGGGTGLTTVPMSAALTGKPRSCGLQGRQGHRQRLWVSGLRGTAGGGHSEVPRAPRVTSASPTLSGQRLSEREGRTCSGLTRVCCLCCAHPRAHPAQWQPPRLPLPRF